MATGDVLRLHGVHKTYYVGAHVVRALQGVDLQLRASEEARALRHIFFAERGSSKAPDDIGDVKPHSPAQAMSAAFTRHSAPAEPTRRAAPGT